MQNSVATDPSVYQHLVNRRGDCRRLCLRLTRYQTKVNEREKDDESV